jgi:hypothetical protein
VTSPAAFGAQHAGDDLAELLDALIDRDAATVTGPLSSRLDLLAPELTRLWVRHFGGTDRTPHREKEAAEFAERAAQRIRSTLTPAAIRPGALEQILADAFALGVESASPGTPAEGLSRPVRADDNGPDLLRPLNEQAAQAISAVAVDAVQARGYDAVSDAVARARRAATRIDATVAYETTQAAADGVTAVARDTGLQVVWVSERDGCLHCLAYAGETTDPGSPFPSGLTFAAHGLNPPGALLGPALHPHCRCVLQAHHPADQDIADALKREARRSVLRGWSHESESQPARLRAAARLLATAAGESMPKSVQKTARDAVKRGRFNDDRPQEPPAPPRAARPDPTPDPVDTVPVDVADLDDEALDGAAQQAIQDGDYALFERIADEMDARDDSGWEAAWEDEWRGFEERTGLSTSDDATVEDKRLDLMARLIAEGVDEGEAYAEAYGVSGQRFVRDEAIRQLRNAGFEGDGFDALARQSYRDHVTRSYLQAEDATRGVLLSREAEQRNARDGAEGRPPSVDPEALFSGPMSRAQRWASDELLDWWETNGRMTFDEWKAQLLGQGQSDARAQGSGRGFAR